MARKSNPVTPTVTDTFPTVGSYDHVMNMSGQRSPYTMAVPRQGPTQPDMGGGNGSEHRSASMIHEAHGPQFRPVATRVYYTDAQPRAMRQMPSSVGNRDFWDARAQSYEGGSVG